MVRVGTKGDGMEMVIKDVFHSKNSRHLNREKKKKKRYDLDYFCSEKFLDKRLSERTIFRHHDYRDIK